MGIFLDTVEDNREMGWEQEIVRYIKLLPDINPMEICPECLNRFFTDQELQDHIFHAHRHKRILVSAEDKIRTATTDSIKIDKNVSKKLIETYQEFQEKLQNRQAIDLDLLNRLIRENTADIVAHQYCQGLFGYLEVSYFETVSPNPDQDIIRRLESVYGYLQPFNDSLAKQIRCAIALKFNWFNALAKAPKESIFYLAYVFFTKSYDDIEFIRLPVESAPRSISGLYVTENLEYLLELIAIFFSDRINKDKFNQLYRRLKNLENISPNLKKKLNLINARVNRKLNNQEEARRSYRKLAYDRDFSQESNNF
ncbi:MAG: hypothetical protein WBA86_21480 [Nodosilinea sp.]